MGKNSPHTIPTTIAERWGIEPKIQVKRKRLIIIPSKQIRRLNQLIFIESLNNGVESYQSVIKNPITLGS
jgi:hypothetical protein